MAIKIDKPIIGYQVVTEEVRTMEEIDSNVEVMNETIERPQSISGTTYKISPPNSNSLYITINNVILNEGTQSECYAPFEVFINSRNMENFQWIVALTRIMSAVFRKGGNIEFMIEELESVFDPKGGYFQKGGKFIPSLVAEIGGVIKQHLTSIGTVVKEELPDYQKAILDEKRAEYEKKQVDESTVEESTEFPSTATLCSKCNTKAVIIMDGCATCLNCGDSKCG